MDFVWEKIGDVESEDTISQHQWLYDLGIGSRLDLEGCRFHDCSLLK